MCLDAQNGRMNGEMRWDRIWFAIWGEKRWVEPLDEAEADKNTSNGTATG